MLRKSKLLRLCALIGAGALLATSGCGEQYFGRLSLVVVDAPVDNAAKVVIEFTGVEVQPAKGDPIELDFAQPKQIDLLTREDKLGTTLLDFASLPSDDYTSIRLKVNAPGGDQSSYIEMKDGTVYPLMLDPGFSDALTLPRDITIGRDEARSFNIDFNLRRSVKGPPTSSGDYLFQPVLRMVDSDTAGYIQGDIQPTLIPSGCAPGIYFFAGSDVTPQDDHPADGNPNSLTSEIPTLNADTGNYDIDYKGFPAGDYTVALTCEADQDNPDTVDNISFIASQNVTVTSGSTAIIHFPPG